MKIENIIFYPFSLLYKGVTAFRNHLYDIDYKKSFEFEANVINVGNLSVGGTGKSPMVEYLINLLSPSYKITTLSRGYGRKTKGFRIATSLDSSQSIGDEPYQFYLKFKNKINVTVGEERAIAIPEILHHLPDTDVILLDDAFQHRTVKAGLNILITTFQNPFYQDYVLPAGRLRESRSGAKRADMIIVSKCPQDIPSLQMDKMKAQIRQYTTLETDIFFTTIKYQPPLSVFGNGIFSPEVVLFSGIANAAILEEQVKQEYHLIKHIRFSDHHEFSHKDLLRIKTEFENAPQKQKVLLTTEKDMARILNSPDKSLLSALPLFYLPIETSFIKDEEVFKNRVRSFIKPFPKYS
jgi:tetraacyldisaccharide 4'-kinase